MVARFQLPGSRTFGIAERNSAPQPSRPECKFGNAMLEIYRILEVTNGILQGNSIRMLRPGQGKRVTIELRR
jgi:hypothetical protein